MQRRSFLGRVLLGLGAWLGFSRATPTQRASGAWKGDPFAVMQTVHQQFVALGLRIEFVYVDPVHFRSDFCCIYRLRITAVSLGLDRESLRLQLMKPYSLSGWRVLPCTLDHAVYDDRPDTQHWAWTGHIIEERS